MNAKKQHSRGFTLMEMIIVIIIIGILVTLTTVFYTGIRKNAVDVSVQSDIEKMESLQTSYSIKNSIVGKAYYSGSGYDAELGFNPTEGNVISVVINSDDYCIRGYNEKGTKTSMEDAFYRESSPGACNTLLTVDPSTPGFDSYPVATSISGYWLLAPDGYLLEDGSAVSRETYSDLFDAIGITFGSGDGSTTFNLPDSRGRVTVNQNPVDTQFTALGQMYGEKTHLLTMYESGIKGHNHVQNAHNHTSTAQKWYGNRWATSWSSSGPGTDVTIGHNGATIDNQTAINQAVVASDASADHNNIQPSIVKSFAIKYRIPGSTTSKLPAGTSISGYWTSAPSGYLVEDGSIVSRATYSSLFTAIGTTFGSGDGSTTFGIPDSRGRVVVNKSSNDSEFNEMGEISGEKTHLVTGSESGEKGHNHTQNAHSHTTNAQKWYGNRWATSWASSGPGIDVTIGHNGATIDNQTATNQAVADSDASFAHNNIQPSIVKLTVIKYSPIDGSVDGLAKGTSIQGYWDTPPAGYFLENGSAISRVAYADLFAAIGTTYGVGDGSTTFNLPDSRGCVAVNVSSSDLEFDEVGEIYGEKTHLLSGAESGEKGHNHTQNAHNHTSNAQKWYGNRWATSWSSSGPGIDVTIGFNAPTINSQTATNQAVVASNASSAHNNIQPSIVQNFAIRY